MDSRSRVAVILHADIIGSTALVQQDAITAHRRFQEAFKLLEDTIGNYGGITHERRGDALVAEFTRAPEAVAAALAFQIDHEKKVLASPDNEIRPQVRTGIAIGEVVVDHGTVTGAGVVLAQRLEQLAEAGGVIVQSAIAESIPAKLSYELRSLGARPLKGFERAVHAVSVSLSPEQSAPEPPDAHEIETMHAGSGSANTSIAVLPFEDQAPGLDEKYLADGIAEELITALSHFRWFSVISRNSSFGYRSGELDIATVGTELNVRYIIQGSIRRAGSRLRVSAQLLDAVSGEHLWVERYDRDLADVFELQDEIANAISAQLEPELGKLETARARRLSRESLSGWEHYLRAMWHLWRFTPEDAADARESFEASLREESEFAPSLAGLAYLLVLEVLLGFTDDADAAKAQAVACGQRAIAADSRNPFAHFALGRALALSGEFDPAVSELRAAVQLNPSFAHGHFGLASALISKHTPEPEEALMHVERAIQLSPHDPNSWGFMTHAAIACLLLGRFAAAMEWADAAVRRSPKQFWPYLWKGAALAQLDQQSAASSEIAMAKKLKPDVSVELLFQIFHWENQENPVIEGLLRAGLDR